MGKAKSANSLSEPRVKADVKADAPSGGAPADSSTEADDFEIRMGQRRFPARPSTFSGRALNVHPDMPDIRDRTYRPHLRALRSGIFPLIAFDVRDQGADSSCTGHALAHVIDFIRYRETGDHQPAAVSARMLYEMAKRNDEWDGTAYGGSSIRGAIKGFFTNGVCREEISPDTPGIKDWALTYDMAKDARELRLGAYFRVEPDISDYHAAINEIGAIYVSAQIHSNWFKVGDDGIIIPGGKPKGGHAFCIVGYNDTGFWVLNSWGLSWGRDGVAHWSYSDWAATVMDAWVLQLGVRAPSAFTAVPRSAASAASGFFSSDEPRRSDILGHFINIDDGMFVTDGRYGSPTQTEMKETVGRFANNGANSNNGFDHLMLYAHGGLNTLSDEAARIATWKRRDVFGRNQIYNFHLMWNSGFLDELFGKVSDLPVSGRAGAALSDWLFEAGPGKEVGSYTWRNMKQDAVAAFAANSGYDGGFKGLKPLLQGLDVNPRPPKLHIVGHSAGSIVIGHLLTALSRFDLKNIAISSIHLMAPACTVDFFAEHYIKFLETDHAAMLDKIYIYSLSDDLEKSDTVGLANFPLLPTYGKSLLYLVSRAYEARVNTPLAGMERYQDDKRVQHQRIFFDISTGDKGPTESTSHGGFDNDAATINTIMQRILGRKPQKPARPEELLGY